MGDRTLKSGHPRASRRDFFVDFFPAFIGGGRPQVPPHPGALFQARAGIWVEPPTFRKQAGWLPHMKVFDPSEDRTYSGEGPVISSQRHLPLGHGSPLIYMLWLHLGLFILGVGITICPRL
jgi:hypothetical protein